MIALCYFCLVQPSRSESTDSLGIGRADMPMFEASCLYLKLRHRIRLFRNVPTLFCFMSCVKYPQLFVCPSPRRPPQGVLELGTFRMFAFCVQPLCASAVLQVSGPPQVIAPCSMYAPAVICGGMIPGDRPTRHSETESRSAEKYWEKRRHVNVRGFTLF